MDPQAHIRREGRQYAVDADSVSTVRGDITGETYVELNRGANATAITSGEWTNIADTTDVDNLTEVDSNQEFVPDATQEYKVEAFVYITGGSNGDTYELQLRDRTAGYTVVVTGDEDGGSNERLHFSWTGELTEGSNYAIRARNFNSSFTIESDAGTYATIKKSVVHP